MDDADTTPVSINRDLSGFHFYPLVTSEDLMDGGIACTDCQRSFRQGEPYAERLEAFIGAGKVLIDIICVYCDLNEVDLHSEHSPAEVVAKESEQEEEDGTDA